MARFPNLFIIGAFKSGTTSLYQYLAGHPDVYMSEVKEPGYFARDLTADQPEASVRYLYSRDAASVIHAARPEARIVAMLCNPVDMAHSFHAHMLAGGAEDIADFETALAAESDRHAGRRILPTANPRLSTYTDRASYGEQLPRWFETFGRDRVHVILFEEFVGQPAAEFRRLLEFLGVSADYQPEAFTAYNVAHGARSRRLRGLLSSRLPQWLVRRMLPALIGDRRTHALVQRFRHSRLHRRPIDNAPISAELRRRLEDDFAPDVAKLSALMGRDLGAFWFGRPVAVA